MELKWLANLMLLVKTKPLVIIWFNEKEWMELRDSRRGVGEFSVARHHDSVSGIKTPAPCILIGKVRTGDEACFGLVSSRQTITTLETRIKIRRSRAIELRQSSDSFRFITNRKFAGTLGLKLKGSRTSIVLTPKLGAHVLETLATLKGNRRAMQDVSDALRVPKKFTGPEAFQEDAVHMALKAFGLSSNDPALKTWASDSDTSALGRISLLEDGVVEHDARAFPEFKMVSYPTGRAIFENGNEQLEIFTANKRPLEKVFGVDLIYYNVTKQCIVMLQYKMLERSNGASGAPDWIYRPDHQLELELKRMRNFSGRNTGVPGEYRLNPAVFYLKFVKRDAALANSSLIMPVEHFERVRLDPICRGPRNALRISFESLSGRYMRSTGFFDLLRSGYIGAYAGTTKNFKILVEEVIRNNKGVVGAIQRSIPDGTVADERINRP